VSIERTYGTFYNWLIVTLAHLASFLRSWNYSLICGSWQWRYGDPSLHRFDRVAECDGQTGRVTDTHSKTDTSMTAKMREALHTVSHEKSCAVLNFARFDSLVCIVAWSREKSRSLSLVLFLARYRSLSLLLTGLIEWDSKRWMLHNCLRMQKHTETVRETWERMLTSGSR